ncbi:MAG TPA: glycine cleavage system aminomethyltransferase GcvT [Bacteroidales bacterium]|nr:glycine cleavage system aminomethyltransferase GcvT [Bacteroidales bacterium]HOR81227.1 glycine cleavage system aminomethyltransferase GcvT [Bacteroidales bacterium]HPJ90494.1 glycine cleavage system aminomethyltransferase GcvT [Bacteroidales bacterium]
MKYTVYAKKHEEIGAKMVEFAGFYMPIQYEGLVIEHEHVRKAVGVFDVSHMGEIYVRGPKALELVQWVSSNDASVLTDGKIQYACFPNTTGGIVDDFLVYRINKEEYLLVVNASNIEKDWNWLVEQNKKIGAKLYNASDEISQLAVQGPLALKAMQKLTDEPIENMEYYTFKYLTFAGVPNVLFSTTGYTGAGGCEIYFKNEDALKIWDAVFKAGKEFDIKPIGLGARDTLRLEMGFCLYGHEINDNVSPLEGGLGWITKFVDHKDFVNKANLLQQKQEGVKRKVVGFEMIDRGIPRQDYEVLNENNNVIGHVCSGTQGPSVKKPIGTALIKTEYAKVGTEIYIKIREKALKAITVKMPFYKG